MFMIDALPALADPFALLVDTVLVKGSLVVGAGILACVTLRHSSASIRHGIWAATFLVLLALPLLQMTGTQERVTIVGAETPPLSVTESVELEAPAMPTLPAAVVSPPAATATPVMPPPAVVSPVARISLGSGYAWIAFAWLVGVMFQTGRFMLNLRALRKVKSAATPVPAAISDRVRVLATEQGVRRVPATIWSREVLVPSTFGYVRPVIALPMDAATWPVDRFDSAVLHELGHLSRRDYVLHLISSVVRAVYWPNPLVGYAAHRLDLERERACDDAVVRDRVDPIRYAEHLMSLALRGRERPEPALSFARRSSLPERVRCLLDQGQTRSRLGVAGGTAIATVAAIAVVSAATVELFGIVQARPGGDGLADPDPLVRRHAAWALGESEDPASVDVLIEALGDNDPRVRAVAAWSLGEIKDRRALDPLVLALRDDDPGVREMAVLAIGELEDPAGLDVLRQTDDAVASRESREWAMTEIATPGVVDLFSGALAYPGTAGGDVARHVADLGHEDPTVRAVAAERLGRIGNPAAVDPLLDALDDEDARVRAVVVWALDEINPSLPPNMR